MQYYSQPDLAWLSLAGSEFGNFLDQMNYSLTQTHMAYPETQYCHSTHLNLLDELHLKFRNPDPA